MAGAETAGLAIGVIALASLFTTCLELLDYYELGKNYLYDYRVACIKTNLLYEQLSDWGCATNILHEHLQHPALRKPAVRGSLEVLRETLSHIERLRKKYDLRLPISHTTTDSSTSCAEPRKLAVWTLHLRRRTTWSIRDKAKFDRSIEEVRDLLKDLKVITETPHHFSIKQVPFTYRDLLEMPTAKDTDKHGKSAEGGSLRGSATQRRQPAPKDAGLDEEPPVGGAAQNRRRTATASDEASEDSGGTKESNSGGPSSKAGPEPTFQQPGRYKGSYNQVDGADIKIRDNGVTLLAPVGPQMGYSIVRNPKLKARDCALTSFAPMTPEGVAAAAAAMKALGINSRDRGEDRGEGVEDSDDSQDG